MPSSTLCRAFLCSLLAGSIAVAPAAVSAQEPVAGPALAPRARLAFGRSVPLTPALSLAPEPEVPAPGPAIGEVEAWNAKHRKLKFQTQLSGGLSGGFLALGLLLIFIPERCGSSCDDPGDGWLIRFFIGMALLPASGAALISTIVHGVKLSRHNKARPQGARLHVAPGGLMLRF